MWRVRCELRWAQLPQRGILLQKQKIEEMLDGVQGADRAINAMYWFFLESAGTHFDITLSAQKCAGRGCGFEMDTRSIRNAG